LQAIQVPGRNDLPNGGIRDGFRQYFGKFRDPFRQFLAG
jgi:hypothetical protein